MPRPQLTKSDQYLTMALLLVAVASVGGWWLAKGGLSGQVINLDRAGPLEYQFLVDLNSAEWPELAQLPDIGEILARRIVEHRQTAGPYQRPEDLLNVRGIGDKKLAGVRKHLLPLPGEEMVAGR